MKFDLWTFAFQIINFGVLLLILKRVLYRPVRDIMEKRRALAVKTQEDAENARREAEELLVKNQAEMQKLQNQRSRMMEEMKTEIAHQRQKLLTETDLDVQRHIDKERALFATEKAHQTTEIQEQATATVALFASQILKGIVDADLHRALYRRLAEQMDAISTELRDQAGAVDVLTVDVASAYPLSAEEEHCLRAGLEKTTGRRVVISAITDQELLAGVKLMAGDRCYDASLRGQLNAFTTKVRKNA
jgi:F-type H+-transporting ATPase subunit b